MSAVGTNDSSNMQTCFLEWTQYSTFASSKILTQRAQRRRVSVHREASRRGCDELAKIAGCFASPGARREQAQFLR